MSAPNVANRRASGLYFHSSMHDVVNMSVRFIQTMGGSQTKISGTSTRTRQAKTWNLFHNLYLN